ncbi:unnamed protein product [Heterobilharzia americana]|nr:unnamed protein product [Heterobilharzia americana]
MQQLLQQPSVMQQQQQQQHNQHFQTQVGTINVNDSIPSTLQTINSGLGIIPQNTSSLQNDSFVQPETDNLSKTDQSQMLSNSERASLINQLTEVIMNNAAQGFLLTGNNYIPQPSHVNSLFNVQPIQQTIPNNHLSQFPFQQIPLSQQQLQQQNQLGNAASFIKPIERRTRKKLKSKPRYVLRVTKIERDSENCEPGNLRPTFYLEMPDLNNPNELWKITFRCNLSDTPEDIKLFQGSGYTPANEDIDRAAKEAVISLLEALRNDVNSVKLNQDYIFYPRPSPVGLDQTLSTPSLSNLPTTLSNTTVVQSGAPVFTGLYGGGGLQSSSSGLPYSSAVPHDASAFMSNFEEVQPLDSKNHEDEDEFSENSRPLSPADNGNQTIHFPFQTIVDGIESLGSFKAPTSSQCASYFTASSSAEGLSTVDSVANSRPRGDFGQFSESVLGSDISNNNFFSQSMLPMNLNYVNDILSLATVRAENGANLMSFQAGLEEVPPLAPPHTNQLASGFIGDSGSTSCNESTSCDPGVNVQPENNAAYQSYGPHALYNIPHLNHVSCNQGGASYSSSSPFNPEGLVNVTITIPSFLEATLRSLVSKLCSNPSHPCILIPTLESNDASSVSHCSSVRVVDIPEEHIFVGVPGDGRMPSGTYLRSTFVTSAKNDIDKAYILVADTHSDDTFSGPHIYKLPRDSALILTHTGNIHLLDRAALVVPVRSIDQSHTVSPRTSPHHESGTYHPTVSSVYVRELPIPADADALSFDDVLALLLALRDAPQGAMQPYHLNLTAANVDHENAQVESKTTIFDSVPGAESLSRRSSSATTAVPATQGHYTSQAQPTSSSGMTTNQPPQNLLSQQQQAQGPLLQTGVQSSLQFSIPASVGQQSTNNSPGPVSSNIAASRLSLPNQIQSFIQSMSQPSPLQSVPPSALEAHTSCGTAYINQPYPSNDMLQSNQSVVAQNQLSLPVNNIYSQQQLLHMKSMPEHLSVTHVNPASLSNIQQLGIQQQPTHVPTQLMQPKELQQQSIASPNTQQLIQLLSALNTLQTLDQVPQLLSNLLKTSNQVVNSSSKATANSGVVATGPSVGVIRHHRQASPPVPIQSTTPSQSQASHIPQRLSVASPPVSNIGACAASVNSLPALLSRLLASAVANSEWSKFSEVSKLQGVQMRPLLQTNLSSASSNVDSQDGVNVQSIVKSSSVHCGGIHTPQTPQQPSLQQQQQQQQQLPQMTSHQQPTQLQSQLQHSSSVMPQQQPTQMQSQTQPQTPPVPTPQVQGQQQTSQISGQVQQPNQAQPLTQPTQINQHQQAVQILSHLPPSQMQQQQLPVITPQIQTHQVDQPQTSQIATQQQPMHQTQPVQSTTQQQSLQMQTHQQPASQQPHIFHPPINQHFQQPSQWQQPQHLSNIMPKNSAPLPGKDRNQQQLSLPAAHSYLSQILPELANAVRLLQQTSDSNSAGLLPVDVQNKLITLLQQQQHSGNPQQQQPQSMQQAQGQAQQSSNQDITFNCTGNVTVPSCASGNNQLLNTHAMSTNSKLPVSSNMTLNRFIVTPSSVSLNTSVPNPVCNPVASNPSHEHMIPLDVNKDVSKIDHPPPHHHHHHASANLPTESSNIVSTRPTVISSGAATIANKFTVAPASLEDDDQTASSVVAQTSTTNQQQQAPPPRPPRQQRPYTGSTHGVHTPSESIGQGSIANGGANVNMPSNMNQPMPVTTLANINSASNIPSANKAIPFKYPFKFRIITKLKMYPLNLVHQLQLCLLQH